MSSNRDLELKNRAMIFHPFSCAKETRKAPKGERVPRKYHASRRRPRIRDRTAHAGPSPYKTTPRAPPSQILRLLASSRSWPELPRHAVAAARLGEEREAAAAPTPRHPRLIPPGTDRYDPHPWFDRVDLWSPTYPRFDLICGFWGFCLGFDRWRRRGSWRSWRTCRRTRPPPAAQVICLLYSSVVCVQILRNCVAIAMYASALCDWVVDWCLFVSLACDWRRYSSSYLYWLHVMSCFDGLLWNLDNPGFNIIYVPILQYYAYMFRELLKFMISMFAF